MSDTQEQKLREEIEATRAAAVKARADEQAAVLKKSEQRRMANLRRERNLLQGKAADEGEVPAPAPASQPAPDQKEAK